MTPQERSRKAGTVTRDRYGSEFYATIGRKGGRISRKRTGKGVGLFVTFPVPRTRTPGTS